MKYKGVNVSFLLASVLFFVLSKQTLAQRQTENSFRSVFGPDFLVGYLAYLPEDYTLNTTKEFPLMIFLHGGGEKIWNPSDLRNLYLVKKNGPPMLIEQGQDFPFIVISPQCPFGDWDMVTTDKGLTSKFLPGVFVNEILENIKKKYRIDTNKVFITGLSIGGAATWNYLMNYPEKIAAAIPIAGWVDGSNACKVSSANTAVWAFQGSLDGKDNITDVISKIKNCHPKPQVDVKATIYEGVGHTGWTETYNNTGQGIAPDSIYEWLMRQSRSTGVITETESGMEAETAKGLKIYPIPAKEEFTATYSADIQEEATISITNESGDIVWKEQRILMKGLNKLDIRIAALQPGFYSFSINKKTGKESANFLIIK